MHVTALGRPGLDNQHGDVSVIANSALRKANAEVARAHLSLRVATPKSPPQVHLKFIETPKSYLPNVPVFVGLRALIMNMQYPLRYCGRTSANSWHWARIRAI